MSGSGPIVVLGGNGRVGQLLAGVPTRPECPLVFQARRPGPGIDWVCDPKLAGPDGFGAGLAALAPRAIFVLWGVTPSASGQDLDANVQLAEIALQGAMRAGVPNVILASSIAVYGAALGCGTPVDEAIPALATAGYGGAKRRMEQMAEAAARAHGSDAPRITVLRMANVLGADQLSASILSGAPVVLDQFPDGAGPMRSYLAPETLARCLSALTARPPSAACFEVLNFADGSAPFDMAEVLRACQRLGVVQDWTWRAAPEGAVPFAAISTARIAAKLPNFSSWHHTLAQPMVESWLKAIGAVQ